MSTGAPHSAKHAICTHVNRLFILHAVGYGLGAGLLLGAVWHVQQSQLWRPGAYAALGLAASCAGLAWWALVQRVGAGLWARAAFRCASQGWVFACGIALMFAWTGWWASLQAADRLNPALEGQDLQVVGVVAAMPRIQPEGVRFQLQVEGAQMAGDGQEAVTLPPLIDIGWYAPRSYGDSPLPAAAMPMAEASIPHLTVGQRWQMTVRVRLPHGSRNPHGFDYERWLWEQGVQAVGYVRQGTSVAAPELLGPRTWLAPAMQVQRWRQQMRDAIVAYLTPEAVAAGTASIAPAAAIATAQSDGQAGSEGAWARASGVIVALVTGEQREISQQDWDIYRTTGVSHLMAISGLHITMFAWAATLLVGWLWRKSAVLMAAVPAPQAALVGGVTLAIAYAIFSGWGVPAQRTSLMLGCWAVLRLLGVRWPWHASLLLACAPLALLQPGFWLSFVAVAILFGIVDGQENKARTNTLPPDGQSAVAPAPAKLSSKNRAKRCVHPLSARLQSGWARARLWCLAGGQRLWRSSKGLFHLQWRISLALAPLTLWWFGQVSVVGLLANLIAIPLVTFVVTPLAMFGALWAPAWALATWVMRWLGAWLEWLATWPLAMFESPMVPAWVGLAGLLGAMVLAARLPWRLRLQGLPLLGVVCLWQPPSPDAGHFTVWAADIGQGNAVLVQTQRHVLLYDTGPRLSAQSDAGKNVLVPFLKAKGWSLDQLVLSHSDSDHTGGAQSVLQAFGHAQTWVSFPFSSEAAQQPVRQCEAGLAWQWDGVQFEFLHPTRSMLQAHARSLAQPGPLWPSTNAMSCVLRIQAADGSAALLTGDIGVLQELDLRMQYGQALRADYLLVPHHGSRSSSSESFIQAVAPQVAVVQSGYRNAFGHPVADVVARYEAQGVRWVASPACGAAIWHSHTPSEIACERERHRRYWHAQ